MLVQDAFKLEELPIVLPLESGKQLPVYRVQEELGLQSRLDWLAETQRLTPYTGREMELTQLMSCYEALLHGTGRAVLVRGDPGIGKSRLLWELKKKLDGAYPSQKDFGDRRPVLWLESHCLPHFQNTNLHPVSDLLEQLVGIQPGDSLEARREKLKATLDWYGMSRPATLWLLSTLLGLQVEASALQTVTPVQREQMRQACLELIQKRAVEQPLILLIEDLHWSDPSTVDWIEKSLTALAASPCMALLTTRPGFNPAWLAKQPSQTDLLQLSLIPLAQQQVEDMVSGLAGDTRLDADLYRHIVTHTDGIPLYIEELAKALLEHPARQSNTGIGSRPAPGIPATLQDSLAARLDSLGTAKETAQWAAVLGREFDLSVLQACVPYEEPRLQGDLARLIQAELITPVETSMQEAIPVLLARQKGRKRAYKAPVRYSFKHALLQDAIYDSLLKRTRREYHLHIAERLQEQFPGVSNSQPEVVAQHYSQAGVFTQAADLWLQAGQQATTQGATMEARTFFDLVLEHLDPKDLERRWTALAGREHVFDLLADQKAQKQDIDALLDLAETLDDNMRRAEAVLRFAQYASRVNDFLLLLKVSDTAHAAAMRTGQVSLEMQALALKIHALTSLGEQGAAHSVVEQILHHLPEITDSMIRANILGKLALYYRSVGDLSLALQLLYQSAEAARHAGDRRWVSRMAINISLVCIQLGLYSQARSVLQEGIMLSEAIGERGMIASHQDNLSYAYWCSGEHEQAMALTKQALETFRTEAYRLHGEAACLAQLGWYLAEVENWDEAALYLKEARIKFLELRTRSDVMEQQALEARCLLALGRQEEALELATEAWSYLSEYGSVGINFPARMYGLIADVFAAIESPPASAREVIETGYRDLMQSAAKISIMEWRKSFLENVTENRTIVERWNRLTGNP
jgi:tetratricopeptide (TPR) repeat protein